MPRHKMFLTKADMLKDMISILIANPAMVNIGICESRRGTLIVLYEFKNAINAVEYTHLPGDTSRAEMLCRRGKREEITLANMEKGCEPCRNVIKWMSRVTALNAAA